MPRMWVEESALWWVKPERLLFDKSAVEITFHFHYPRFDESNSTYMDSKFETLFPMIDLITGTNIYISKIHIQTIHNFGGNHGPTNDNTGAYCL